jgi:hypothetical protein
MKKTLLTLAVASLATATLSAQSIDYGMIAAEIQSPLNTPLPVSTGGFQLYVTNGAFTPSSLSTLTDITSNMRLVTGSFTSTDAALAGQFYLSGIFPATLSGNIPTGTLLYALASTSSSFSPTSPWALITGSDSSWLSPNASDATAATIIELSYIGNSIVSAGFGGPGVGAYFGSTPGSTTSTGDQNIVLVPEPSTYALLGMSALALGSYVVRRRRRA